VLELDDIHVFLKRTYVLKGISLFVRRGEIVALIGANGAGKSTTLAAISGLRRPRQGRMVFRPEPGGPELDLTKAPAEEIVAAGLSHCPEGRQIFSQLTVKENLRIGAYLRRDQEAVGKDLDWVCRLFPVLAERLGQRAGTLSGGEQMMLAIGRALMSRPKLLLMDEPSLGLAPLIVEQIFEILARLNREGVTLLLVEQNAQLALELAQRAYVLETGRMTLTGTGKELAGNELVQRAYLGAV